MSKNLSIIIVLSFFMLVGTIPFVMGVATNPSTPSTDLNQRFAESNMSSPSPLFPFPSPNKWYYSKVNTVSPTMEFNDTWVTFTDNQTGSSYSTYISGFNSSPYLQNQIVNCIVTAQGTNHYIYLHTDRDHKIEQVQTTNFTINESNI